VKNVLENFMGNFEFAKCVAKLLINIKARVNAATRKRWTPLHIASQNGHLEVSNVGYKHFARAPSVS